MREIKRANNIDIVYGNYAMLIHYAMLIPYITHSDPFSIFRKIFSFIMSSQQKVNLEEYDEIV